jgi:hypothetical protein
LPIAKIIYIILGERVYTSTLSNLGVIEVPPELEPYIKKMDFVLGTVITNRASCSMVTFKNTATFTIAKHTKNPMFENEIYKMMKENGITPTVSGSKNYGN